MQRQQIISNVDSDLSSNPNKNHSRSVRKLYNRMGNNIRVLNKSRVSNRSNNSIGSVALRRTQLSNDKIYSREEEFLANDSHEIDFQSEMNYIKGSINTITSKGQQSLTSNNKQNRQRIKLSKQSFSRRSSSQKSYQYNKGVAKKPTKNQIQKLFMMEDQKMGDNLNSSGYKEQNDLAKGYNNYNNFNGKQYNEKHKRLESGNNYHKENKQSIRSSRQRPDENYSKNNKTNLRLYKLNESTIKSNIKSSKQLSRQSKEIKNYRYIQNNEQCSQVFNNGSELKRLSRKYKNSCKSNEYQQNKNIKNYYSNEKQHFINSNKSSQYQIQRKKKDDHSKRDNYYFEQKQKILRQMKKEKSPKQFQDKKRQKPQQYYCPQQSICKQKQKQYYQKSNQLHKYNSEKYIMSTTNDSDIIYIKKQTKKNVAKNQKYHQLQFDRKTDNYENKDKQSSKQRYNPKKKIQVQNSLQKYQLDQWAREKNRRHATQTYNYASQKQFLVEQSSVLKNNIESKYNRQRHRKNKNDMQRSSILLLSSKNSDSRLRRDIRIKEKEYAYLYGGRESYVEDDLRVRRSSKKLSYKNSIDSTSRLHSPRNPKPYQQQNEYYAHMTPTSAASKNYLSVKQSPTTQISSTLDSLLLSINSHISVSQNQRSSISILIDKLNLHVKTLQIISDYSKQFKKMYEDFQQWEELIFLSCKKYWVERVKVIEYLKKFFVPVKRHTSQKINLKAQNPTIKNTKDQPLSSLIIEDPFSSNSLLQNPFTIPFCKVSQQQLNKLIHSPQVLKLLSRFEQQTSQVYKHLQQLYNQFITKCHNPNFNMLYCDNFSDQIYLQMLAQIQKLLPNLQEFKVFQVTKIRLGKIVKAGILILHLNGKYVRNISEIVMFDDCEKIGQKKKLKTFATYDLYYEVFEKLVVD